MHMDVLFEKVYSRNQVESVGGFVEYAHIQRIKMRLSECKQKSPMLRELIAAETINLNGEEYENIPSLIRKIESHVRLMNILEPPILCMIHGDLHFDNFLVNIKKLP